MHVQQASSAVPGAADGRTPGVQDASVSGAESGEAELPNGGAELPAGRSVGEAAAVDEGLVVPVGPPEPRADASPASRTPTCPPQAQTSRNRRDRNGDTPFVRIGMVNLRPSMWVSTGGKEIAAQGSVHGPHLLSNGRISASPSP
jgi:hypothetical protein